MNDNCKERKRILFLQNVIFDYRRALYNELSKHYSITILHSGQKTVGFSDKYKEIITPIMRIGPFCIQRYVINHVRSGHYDIVIGMFDLYWINNIIAFLFRKNIPFIWWGHRYSKNSLANIIRNLLMEAADAVILYSGTEIDKIKESGIDLSKIFVAQNTIYVPNSEDLSKGEKDSLLFVGRTNKKKKIDILIKAFSEVIDKIPKNIKLKIVGSGRADKYLRSLAKELNLEDRILFYGSVLDHDILKKIFGSAFAYISPGPVGLGALQSFAYGIPVVTHRYEKHGQEFDDLRDGKNSIIFGKIKDLKEIIRKLCNDVTVTMALGEEAYKFYVCERRLEIMVRGFIGAITYCLHKGIREGKKGKG